MPTYQTQVTIKGRKLIAEFDYIYGAACPHTWRHPSGRLFRSLSLEQTYNFNHAREVQLAAKEDAEAVADRY